MGSLDTDDDILSNGGFYRSTRTLFAWSELRELHPHLQVGSLTRCCYAKFAFIPPMLPVVVDRLSSIVVDSGLGERTRTSVCIDPNDAVCR